ncbi:MAG: B12-binding domain-containing radical SAM protein [bacterium]|nr:B12-binding domain-containing radical SAM protein [bacterium]
MKIGFIAPALDLDREKQGERIFLLPPLTFPVLAALTPDDIEVEIIEERLQPIPYTADYDLVGLTFVTAFAPYAYSIADKFRELGIKVVMGGPHASVFPGEALQHADAVVVGEAEEIWQPLLRDFQQGRMNKIYQASGLVDLKNFPQPRLDLAPKEFAFRNSTLASKGCPFRCNFCFTSFINQYQQRFRHIDDVFRDIEAMDGNWLDRKHFVFWDDNLFGNPRYAKELLRAITPLNKRWAAAASVNIATDPETVRLLEQAGCAALFIGLESINSASLQESQKYHNHVSNYHDMVKRLHDHGIGITGAFVFGFDQDDRSVFDRTLEFAIKIDLDCMTPAILTPLPGTPFYHRIKQEGRIFDHDWSHYDYYHVVFEPKQMTAEELYSLLKNVKVGTSFCQFSLKKCQECLVAASKLYDGIRIGLDSKSNRDHLEPLAYGVKLFTTLAEIDFTVDKI